MWKLRNSCLKDSLPPSFPPSEALFPSRSLCRSLFHKIRVYVYMYMYLYVFNTHIDLVVGKAIVELLEAVLGICKDGTTLCCGPDGGADTGRSTLRPECQTGLGGLDNKQEYSFRTA